MEAANRNFFPLVSDDGSATLLNLNQIRMVDQISGRHCRVWFSDTHMITVDGTIGGQLALILLGRRIDLKDVPSGEIPTER